MVLVELTHGVLDAMILFPIFRKFLNFKGKIVLWVKLVLIKSPHFRPNLSLGPIHVHPRVLCEN